MTSNSEQPVNSMRFEISEVLSGMLASVEQHTFTDDPSRLATMFADLSGRFSLFKPFESGVDPKAVADALVKLEQKHYLTHGDQHYTLTDDGKAHCVSSKRTLFNQGDREQLEAAALVFDTL
jgi:hypothetical protein